jgi:hypothetical protein
MNVAPIAMLGALSLLFVGCAQGLGPTLPPSYQAPAHESLEPATALARHGVVYAVTGSPSGTYIINEYPQHNPKNRGPLCTIDAGTSIFPGDLTTDPKGNLWVPTIATPSISALWEIVQYGPNCGAALTALDDSTGGQPIGIALDKKGTAFVANLYNASFGPGDVTVYPRGKTQPTRVLTSSLIVGFVDSIAVDANNDVYIVCDGQNYSSQVVEFAKGKGSGTLVNITGFSALGGIAFDRGQRMILTDYGTTQDEIYAPPYYGSPTETIALQSGSQPFYSKVNKRNSALYVTGHTGIAVYSYPGGAYKYTVTNGIGRGGAGGVALEPMPPL